VRDESEFKRIYGGWDRLAWGYGQPCLIVGCDTRDRRPGSVQPIECAHTENGGMGRKADSDRTVFVCWRHHDELDRGKKSFDLKYAHRMKVDGVKVHGVREAAEETERAWRRHLEALDF
jgi:hypothetical protein